MDLFVCLIIITLALCCILWRNKVNNKFWKYIMAIPGPYCYPIVGTVDMLMANNEMQFEVLRRRALTFYPLYKVYNFGFATVYLINPDDIQLVLRNTKHITKGEIYKLLQIWLGTGLLTSTDSKWLHRRKILTPAFHFNILKDFINIFNKETGHLINAFEEISSQPYINVTKYISDFTLNSVGGTSFGVQFKNDVNNKMYRSSVYEFGALLMYQFTRPWLKIKTIYNLSAVSKKINQCVNILHNFSSNVIKQRTEWLKNNSDSYVEKKNLALLDLLLKIRKEEGYAIDDEGIREEVDTIMFEGHDTVAQAICFTLLVLASKPKIQSRILQEIYEVLGEGNLPDLDDLRELKYMERCIKEVLRLFPSVPTIFRRLGDDLILASGYLVPKGTNVGILIYDMHRSPHVWENPEDFDPDRFLPENVTKMHPFSYLPFSAGQRNCIGQKYALLEIKALLCGILRHFELKPVDKVEDVKLKADMILRSAKDIRIQFVSRKKNRQIIHIQ